MDAQIVIQYLNDLLNGFMEASNWLTTPINFGTFSISPLVLTTFTGLVLFLGVAIIKWLAS